MLMMAFGRYASTASAAVAVSGSIGVAVGAGAAVPPAQTTTSLAARTAHCP